jgi:hypothetical protein
MKIKNALAMTSALLVLTGAQEARALPTGFGTTCSISGSTYAQSGNPGVLSGDAQSFAGACASNQVESHGRVDVPVQTINGPNLYSFAQNSVASARASGSLGSLGVYAASQADSTPASYIYTTPSNTGGIAENVYLDNAQASATSAWYDTITVGGATNANGFVVLKFTLDLHGTTSASPPDSSAASIGSRFFINDGVRNNGQILGLDAQGSTFDTIGFQPGQQIQLYGDLTASATALAGQKYLTICSGFVCGIQVAAGYFPDSNAVADAANTAGFHVDVVTAGGSYSSLSGQSYVTAVPLPASAWFFGSALSLLAFARRQIMSKSTVAR